MPKKNRKTETVRALLEPELNDQVNDMSETTGISKSNVVRRFLEYWVDTGQIPQRCDACEGKGYLSFEDQPCGCDNGWVLQRVRDV